MTDAINFKKSDYLAVLDIGTRNTGKTHETLQWIDDYIGGRKKYKVFIFMTLDHKKYKHFKEIKINEIPAVTQGVAKIISSDFDKIFLHINKRTFTDAFLIFEDCSSYFTTSRLDAQIKRFIVDSKQKSFHLLFQFHAWGFIQPDFFRIVDFLRIHKTIDGPQQKKTYIGMYEEVEKIYFNVKNKVELKQAPHYYAEEIRIGA